MFREQAVSSFFLALRVRGKELRNIMNELQKARCDSFKSIDVGKSGNLKPEEIEKLPDHKPRNMKDFWKRREFIGFLKVFKDMIPAVASQESKTEEKKKFPHDEINATLPFFTRTWIFV